ncbi:hypothetical protein HELRODRAFT_176161 [Helobdella robusta]|uniref:DUF3668 domain-containing protein n=1 Tax=Helobdella robusta TaxID=6412 RepID=T1FA84_HELRO|nr:hypothetical protein HELRODRAFT_176161 [Helobdella robusta]ESO00296.1 hypothetical protein HELRODRAFT_176161 [Helobdella robusta]
MGKNRENMQKVINIKFYQMSFSTQLNTYIVDQPRSFKPILNASTGCYEIGSVASGTEIQFVFSVVVALAANLTQLLHDDSIVDASSGYFFYYNLIDLDVTTEVFYDLSNPKFKVDRTYVKIIGDCNDVKNYFSEIENFEVGILFLFHA